MAILRLAREDDAEAMLEIYSPEVRETPISFELEPPGVEEYRQRIRSTLELAPWLVCELAGRVAGFCYAGPFRPRPAYRWTVEVTVYVRRDCQGRGIGAALYRSLLSCLRLQGFRSALAAIALPNPASVALHERMGFRPIGVVPAAGWKLGRWHDVGWWGLALQALPEPPPPPLPPAAAEGSPEWDSALRNGARLVKD